MRAPSWRAPSWRATWAVALVVIAVATRHWWLAVVLIALFVTLHYRTHGRARPRAGGRPAPPPATAAGGGPEGRDRLTDAAPPPQHAVADLAPAASAPDDPAAPAGAVGERDPGTVNRLPPGEEAVRGVEVVIWPDGSAQVGIWALALTGGTEVGATLRRQLRQRLAAVAGVDEVVEDGDESYRVTGTAASAELLAAAAAAVDGLTDQIVEAITGD